MRRKVFQPSLTLILNASLWKLSPHKAECAQLRPRPPIYPVAQDVQMVIENSSVPALDVLDKENVQGEGGCDGIKSALNRV